jgi:hypothetical protein
VVIDCESEDGSREHFHRLSLSQGLAFDWLEWPLNAHPVTLDRVFDEIQCDKTLLIDSDLEIRTSEVIDALCAALASNPEAYGAGFLHGPCWIGEDRGLHAHAGYYVERMWIPFTLLRTEVIRRARREGGSFMSRRPFVDLPGHPTLARLLGYRYRIRGLRKWKLPLPQASDRVAPVNAEVPSDPRPSFVEFDTGALLHLSLKERGHPFVALPDDMWGQVHHYHGVTRAALSNAFRRALKTIRLATIDSETSQRSVVGEVHARMMQVYEIDWRR